MFTDINLQNKFKTNYFYFFIIKFRRKLLMKQFHILICMFTGAVKDVTTIYFNDY